MDRKKPGIKQEREGSTYPHTLLFSAAAAAAAAAGSFVLFLFSS